MSSYVISEAAHWVLDHPQRDTLWRHYRSLVVEPESPWAGEVDYTAANEWLVETYRNGSAS